MKRTIIGPRFYQVYLVVLIALTGAGLVASLVTIGMSVFSAPSDGVDVLDLMGRASEMFFSVFLTGIGAATLSFAVLERLMPEDEIKLPDIAGLNIENLVSGEEDKPIKPARLIVEMVFLALLLILFIFFSNWTFLTSNLSAAFFAVYLPLMEIRWGLTILQNLVLLRKMHWQPGTRLSVLLLEIFDIYILIRLITGPSMLAGKVLEGVYPTTTGLPGVSIDAALRLAFSVALVVIVVLTVFKAYGFLKFQIQKSRTEHEKT